MTRKRMGKSGRKKRRRRIRGKESGIERKGYLGNLIGSNGDI